MNAAVKALHVARCLGPRWAAYRLRYGLERRLGVIAGRSPISEWPIQEAPAVRPRLFWPGAVVGAGAVREADAVLAGRFRLFSHEAVEAGFPPDWHRNQLTNERAAAEGHWSSLNDAAFGDIKGVWELSRLSWAFALGRAYAHTSDERYANGFWQLFEHWIESNPPNRGANWMCGQEATFRLCGATFAHEVLQDSPVTTPERTRRFQSFVTATARRIAGNIEYALSQSNNHGVSECVGLITAAILLPAEPSVASAARKAWRQLERQIADLVYADGAFSQHSAIYHRVLLHNLVWLVTIARRTGQSVPEWLMAAGRRAVEFAHALMTPHTGRVPLYGANDGANILPLADHDFLDFRPTVQAGYAVFFGTRALEPGPWDEFAEWLVAEFHTLPRTPVSDGGGRFFREGGCLIWRTRESRLFFRCPVVFRHRPAQADSLHVDLEWRDQPIAHDGGTHSYAKGSFLQGALNQAASHNTLTFDGGEPFEKITRFLYLPWPRGWTTGNERSEAFTATHDAWGRRGLRHVRTIVATEADGFEVRDEVTGPGPHTARVHWLLADVPYELDLAGSRLRLKTASGDFIIAWRAVDSTATIVRADRASRRGWWSPYYNHAAPALSLAIEVPWAERAEIVTTLQPAP